MKGKKNLFGMILMTALIASTFFAIPVIVSGEDCPPFGDLTGDGKVDMKDIAIVAKAYGSLPGDSNWNPDADVNGDNKVDIKDIALVVKNFGKSCPDMQCITNWDCSMEEYCAKAIGDCDGVGTCEQRPQICIFVYDPVCGCDGRTYGNACSAASSGVSVDYLGECVT